MLAIILSILFPGLGQIFLGKTWPGLSMVLLGLTPLYPIALIWSITDIIRLNKRGLIPAFDRKQTIWAIVLFLVVIPACFYLLGISHIYIVRAVEKFSQPRLTQQEGVEIANAIARYHDDTGTLPPTINDLIRGRAPRAGWRTDAWGNEYIYVPLDNGLYTLFSTGPDGIPNTEDDLVIRK
jgi:hypothetical protein